VSFGRFQVSPHRREFLADGRLVQIGGHAFNVLLAQIDAQGSVVSKNALMERVWPDRIVEENNLQIQISALRAAFGADRENSPDDSWGMASFVLNKVHSIVSHANPCKKLANPSSPGAWPYSSRTSSGSCFRALKFPFLS
jgi:Transcriptional regulatory protein, C terminal